MESLLMSNNIEFRASPEDGDLSFTFAITDLSKSEQVQIACSKLTGSFALEKITEERSITFSVCENEEFDIEYQRALRKNSGLTKQQFLQSQDSEFNSTIVYITEKPEDLGKVLETIDARVSVETKHVFTVHINSERFDHDALSNLLSLVKEDGRVERS